MTNNPNNKWLVPKNGSNGLSPHSNNLITSALSTIAQAAADVDTTLHRLNASGDVKIAVADTIFKFDLLKRHR